LAAPQGHEAMPFLGGRTSSACDML
jgi:hypothetical protein